MADDDPWDSVEMKEWARDALTNMVPQLKASSIALSLLPRDGVGDIKYWVELGASVMLDKPLLVVVLRDQEVPRKLELVADQIVRLDSLDGDQPELVAAIKRMSGS